MVHFNARCALKAESLAKSYGDVAAVNDVSLEVYEGECFALLGPNGAGKTTTCEILEGLIPPDHGTVHLLGMDLAKERKQILENIGVQLQETTLYKKYTVRETLQLFASFYKLSVSVDDLIARLSLQEKFNSRLEHLSGGQRQRVYLGCSLVNNPRLLFLDEPSAGLDPQARRMMWDLLKDLKKDKKSILLTTHYMEEAQELADRIAIMDKGKIIAQGTLKQLLQSYCPQEVLSFYVSEKEKGALMNELVWLQKLKFDQAQERYEVSVDDAATCVQELIRAADKLGVKMSSLQMRASTLEDVFLHLTGRSIRNA